MTKEALIIVDPQNDFCPGGSLAVKDGDKIMEPVNKLVAMFRRQNGIIFASRDWHNLENTVHMGPGKWPVHCIKDTVGAQFHKDLDLSSARVITKGVENRDDGYSAFEGRSQEGRILSEELHRADITDLVICGLATDYCVKATVLDALELGFRVRVPLDAIRAVNLKAEDGKNAIREMQRAGAVFTRVDRIS